MSETCFDTPKKREREGGKLNNKYGKLQREWQKSLITLLISRFLNFVKLFTVL